ncbi:MAG: cyclase family protein [Anaerovorax sp.]|nr:cyclase family protein [Anaerovorax sp.]
MKIVDLTHVIEESMPVYPGTEGPNLIQANTYEKDGFKETILHMFSHTGTHMDAPAHIKPEGMTLDAFDVSQFVGKAIVVDCHDLCEGDRINMSYILKQQKEIDEADFVLFSSGWSRYWGTDKYYGDFTVADTDVLEYLINTGKKGIGMDAISIEPN